MTLTTFATALLATLAAQDVALKGARIHTLEGDPIDNGTVVLREGKIFAVGASVEIPAGAQVIDVSGQVIIPGLVDAGSFALLARADRGTPGDAHLRVADALEEFNEHAVEPLLGGVTCSLVLPDTTGPARGIAAVAKFPHAAAARPTVVVPAAAVVLSLSAGDPHAVSALDAYTQYAALKKQFEEVKKHVEAWEKYAKDLEEYQKKKKEFDEAKKKEKPEEKKPRIKLPFGGGGKPEGAPAPTEPKEPAKPARDARKDVLARLFVEGKQIGIDGAKLPLFLEANTRDEIRFALKLKEEFGLGFTLVGGVEAALEAGALAAAKVAVVYGPALTYGPPAARYFRHTAETPARLATAGVKFSLASLPVTSAGYPARPEHDPSRFLMLSAARAVAGGLDRRLALRAVTIDAAETIGLKDRIGTIFPGKDADLVVLTGEPFELETRVSMVFVDGNRGAK